MTVTGTTANMSTDGIRALAALIDHYLDRVAAGETFAALGAAEVINAVQGGDNPHVIHAFQFVETTDFDAVPAVVAVDYVGSFSDTADITFPS